MTTEDLDCIDRALSMLVVHPTCSLEAKSAVLRFNARIQPERSRLGSARAMQQEGCAVDPSIEIELKASAVMFAEERNRVVRLWRIPFRYAVA
jgi:hypothetical protein